MIESVLQNMEDSMYHYCYMLVFLDGMKYVGARSTNLKPELDTTYLGSGTELPTERKDAGYPVTKIILGTFSTREELMDFEKNFIVQNGCIDSPDWYNKRTATFDRHGSEPWNKGVATGQTSHVETFKKRYCNGYRTPAQIAGAESMKEKLTGVKNPDKGLHGVSNNGFKPWYSISPEGKRVEHTAVTKEEFGKGLGVSKRQIYHRFHPTNEHKKARTLPLKGWTFGNL